MQKDNGPNPYVTNIEALTVNNTVFRQAAWTGSQLQMTLMCIPEGGDIGLEVHNNIDQFLRIEQGKAKVEMGEAEDSLTQTWEAEDDWAIFVPAGTWHNITNIGDQPLKLYSIYAPPEHPHSTLHQTKAEADAAEAQHQH